MPGQIHRNIHRHMIPFRKRKLCSGINRWISDLIYKLKKCILTVLETQLKIIKKPQGFSCFLECVLFFLFTYQSWQFCFYLLLGSITFRFSCMFGLQGLLCLTRHICPKEICLKTKLEFKQTTEKFMLTLFIKLWFCR